MLHFIVRRILLMIPTLFVISALVYFIIDLPGARTSLLATAIEQHGNPLAHDPLEEG